MPSTSGIDAGTCPTIFIRCASISTRGELVNKFLFSLREELDISHWYESGNLKNEAPVELVEVKFSRKPYFLLEFRLPLAEELQRRKIVSSKESVQGKSSSDSKNEDTNRSSWVEEPQKLSAVSQALLSLGEKIKEYNEQPISITAAMAGISVHSERMKIEGRDRLKKREREAGRPSEKTEENFSIGFVPRAVRRRD